MLGSLTKRRWHLLVLALLALALLLPGLSSLPVIDRDEARFAQASVQMAESNDLLNIRFQDEARNKKPAGAYWAQTAMLKVFSRDGERRIWVNRLPSVLAALISILALYWGGTRMIGRDAALIAAICLAISAIFIFEGHIAKSDALLCAATTVIFACLGRLRHGAGKLEVWGFWIALGSAIMIKGPIGPILALFTLLSLWAWEKHLSWAKPLLNWGAILVFCLIWLPWVIAISAATDGAFFAESLGKDFGGKITSGQEGHGAPPGSHSLVIWLTLWPSSLFLLPALAYAVKSVKSGEEDNAMTRSMRFALCWVVPFWVLIEIIPTKLPHYSLPIFPALCLMIGTVIMAMKQVTGFKAARLISGLFFTVSTVAIIGVLVYGQKTYGDSNSPIGTYIICLLAAVAAFCAAIALWRNKAKASFGATIITAMILTVGTYGYILPQLTAFQTSARVKAELDIFAPDAKSADIHSPHYAEPSLVYHLGTDINLKGHDVDISRGSIVILNARRENVAAQSIALAKAAKKRKRCLKSSNPINGFNYSNGTPLSLVILREELCEVSRRIEQN